MSPSLQALLQQVEQLPPEERLELIQRVAAGLQQLDETTKPKPKWSDLKGLAPYPMMGEDAQAWVSRTRREADEHRERVVRGE